MRNDNHFLNTGTQVSVGLTLISFFVVFFKNGRFHFHAIVDKNHDQKSIHVTIQ